MLGKNGRELEEQEKIVHEASLVADKNVAILELHGQLTLLPLHEVKVVVFAVVALLEVVHT